MRTVGLVTLKNRKLLLAFSNNKNAYYLPGGKTDPGESSLETLMREVSEELNILLSPDQLKFYTHITAPAFGEEGGILMEQDCYILDLDQIPHPGAEIASIGYFDRGMYSQETSQAPGVVLLIQKLKQDDLMD